MNVTFNPNFNNSYRNNFQNKKQQPSFTAWQMPPKSEFTRPFKVGMDKLTDFIAANYTKRVYESPVAMWLSKQKDASQIVNHMQMIGSVIVSGMYMTQTLRNQNMDDETKKKLSINQALTFAAATAGAYWFDDILVQKWDKHVALKYAQNFLKDNKLPEKLAQHNKILEKEFNANPLNAGKKFKPDLIGKYVEKRIKNDALMSDLKGLDVLKSLLIFGTIYRFISPVAVTPFANMIGDMIFAKKEAPVENKEVVLSEPKMAKFAGGFKILA